MLGQFICEHLSQKFWLLNNDAHHYFAFYHQVAKKIMPMNKRRNLSLPPEYVYLD